MKELGRAYREFYEYVQSNPIVDFRTANGPGFLRLKDITDSDQKFLRKLNQFKNGFIGKPSIKYSGLLFDVFTRFVKRYSCIACLEEWKSY